MVSAPLRVHRLPVETRGVLAVGVAVVLWSATTLFVRAGDSDALIFTTYRLWFALPPLALIVASRARRRGAAHWRPPGTSTRRWALLFLGAGAFFVSGAGTMFAALNMTRLLDVTLIGALQPVLIIGFAVAFLGEHAGRGHVVRAVLAVTGVVVVAVSASSTGSWSLAGDVVAIVSLVANSGWFLYGRVLRTSWPIDPFVFLLGTLTAAALLITPVALVANGGLGISGRGLFFAACTMTAGTTAHTLVVWAHRYVPTSVSSPFLLGEAPLVAIGAWVCFGESVGVLAAVGSAIVVGALWGIVRAPALEHQDVPDPSPPT
ncbi:MAG TPA: DMT family transporter [Acidimicrobiia bacterium]|nr:DMT family transporter [Acidimicrobiia bacterium]